MIEFVFRIAITVLAFFPARLPSLEKPNAAGVDFISSGLGVTSVDRPEATPRATPLTQESVDDSPATSLFARFLRLGVNHILTGYDHLIFLLGLLLVCDRIRSVIVIISSFTLAHTATLALSTLNLFALPDRWIEPLIAVTIMAVGLENLIGRGDLKRRSFIAFCFGLIHGFAFAGVLRSLLLGSLAHGLILPLFSFNLGVEMGQIAVAVLIVPALWWLRQSPTFQRFGNPSLSVLVTLVGFYWLIERTVFS